MVAACAVVALGFARRRLTRTVEGGKFDAVRIQHIRRQILALLFVCGVSVAVAMSAAVVAASRAGDDTMSALAWGGLLAGVIVAAGAVLNAVSLWRSGRW